MVSFGRTKCDRSVVSDLKTARMQEEDRIGGSKCTNHSRPLWYKWYRAISRPYRLKKTSSKQSKRRDQHLKWLHRETNDNTLYYSLTTVAKWFFTYPHSPLGDKQYCCPVLCTGSACTDICCHMLFRYWYTLDPDGKCSFHHTHSEVHGHRTLYKLEMVGNIR